MLYRAFTSPDALESWLAPGRMTGKIHQFDLRVGGGYEMSLFYPESDLKDRGKTSAKEDRFSATFVELTPPSKIVQKIAFDTTDPALTGEMTMTTTFEETDGGTEVRIVFENIPEGIRPEDNDKGTRQSIEKLARYAEKTKQP